MATLITPSVSDFSSWLWWAIGDVAKAQTRVECQGCSSKKGHPQASDLTTTVPRKLSTIKTVVSWWDVPIAQALSISHQTATKRVDVLFSRERVTRLWTLPLAKAWHELKKKSTGWQRTRGFCVSSASSRWVQHVTTSSSSTTVQSATDCRYSKLISRSWQAWDSRKEIPAYLIHPLLFYYERSENIYTTINTAVWYSSHTIKPRRTIFNHIGARQAAVSSLLWNRASSMLYTICIRATVS